MSFGGVFPFGRPSTARPPRRPDGSAALFVLGVYPSALHVEWTLPTWFGARRVAAMAVDVEPVVFWDGRDPDPAALIDRWRDDVGFVEGDGPGSDGHLRGVRLNGSSGDVVDRRVVRPLGATNTTTWFTDAVPWFFVKHGSGGRREQGDVVRGVYNVFASSCGRPQADLPTRPTPASLVATTIRTERDRLRREILESETTVVVTLGEEARRALAGVADSVSGPPTQRLDAVHYGEAGEVEVDGRRSTWLALVHPGQRGARWIEAHDHWLDRRRRS